MEHLVGGQRKTFVDCFVLLEDARRKIEKGLLEIRNGEILLVEPRNPEKHILEERIYDGNTRIIEVGVVHPE